MASVRRSVFSFILFGLVWIFGGAFAAAPEEGTDSADLDFDRFQVAVEQALAGRPEEALDLGRTLIAARPADWRGWYLRLLARDIDPLTPDELSVLKRTDDERYEILRGMRDYFDLTGQERGELTATLAERFPESGLAASLNAASLWDLKETAASLAEARRALDLDPRSVIAARVEMMASEGRPAQRACELAAAFRSTEGFLRVCQKRAEKIAEAEQRVSALRPLLVSLAGRESLAETLRVALGDQIEALPESAREAILVSLEPEDVAWRSVDDWVMRLGTLSAEQGSRTAATFFERAALSADRSTIEGVRFLERAARISAIAWLRAGQAERAAEVARRNAEALPMHLRPALYERLVEAAEASGRSDLRSMGQRDLDVVYHPFDAASRNDDRFLKVGPTALTNALGEEIEIDWSHPATLAVFWRTTCHWSRLELARLAPRSKELRDAEDLEVLWVNTDKESYREKALTEAGELKLENDRLFFGDAAAHKKLERDLLVNGTPYFILVARGGRIVAEWIGYNEEGWADEIARLVHEAGASKGATVRGRVLDPEGEPLASVPVGARSKEAEKWEPALEASTGADGRFRFDGLEAGSWMVHVVDGRHRPMSSPVVELIEGATEEIELRLLPGRSVEGKVMRDGEAVPGAVVRVEEIRNLAEPLSTETDSEGRFRLSGLPEGQVLLSAERESDGYVRHFLDPDDTYAVLNLADFGTIEGSVAPHPEDAIHPPNLVLPDVGRMIEIGPDGSFRDEHVLPGRIRVRLLRRVNEDLCGQSRLVNLESGVTERVDFPAVVSVSGWVTFRDDPAPGARLTFTRMEGGRPKCCESTAVATAMTDQRGHYETHCLEPGDYAVSVEHEGLTLHKEAEIVDSTTLDLQLRGTRVAGWVVDAEQGTPVEGARIEFFEPDRSGGLLRSAWIMGDGQAVATSMLNGTAVEVLTDDGGAFEVVLPHGSYRARIEAEGYRSAEARLEVSDRISESPTFALHPAHRLYGLVDDAAGFPVAGAVVGLRCTDENSVTYTSTGLDGRFEYDNVGGLPCAVLASLGAEQIGFVELIYPPDRNFESRVVLLPPGTLTFRCSAGSAPPELRTSSGLQPSFLFSGSLLHAQPEARQEGDRIIISWPALPAATYMIRAPGTAEWSPVSVDGGRETVVDFTH